MAKPSYMSIKDDKGQDVKGGVLIADRKGTSEVLEFSTGVKLPLNPHTNAPAGVREHDGFTVVTVMDATYPVLVQALTTGKRFKSVEINAYAHDEQGKEKITHTFTLEDVIPSVVEAFQPNVLTAPNNPQQYKAVFRYSKITQVWKDGNVTATDDWKASRSA